MQIPWPTTNETFSPSGRLVRHWKFWFQETSEFRDIAKLVNWNTSSKLLKCNCLVWHLTGLNRKLLRLQENILPSIIFRQIVFFDFRLSNPSWMVIWMVAWKACFHIRCKWDGLTTYQHSEQPTLSGASLTWRLETFRVPPSWNMNGNSQSKTVHLGNSPLNHLHELSDCLIIDVSTLFWTWPSKTAEA